MGKGFLVRRNAVAMIPFLILCLSLTSCDSLRKKFIRQKKKGTETSEFIPVLEPQEYPAPEFNPIAQYKGHYGLIKAWYRDLWTGVEDKNSDGIVKNALKQIFDHIEQMKPLIKPDKAEGLTALADLLKFYQSSLAQPRHVRNYARIQSDLRAFNRMLREKFRDDRLEGAFVNP